MKRPAIYHLTIFNEITEKEEKVHGVTFGDTYADVMRDIEAYYGNEIVRVDGISLLEESEILELPQEIADKIEARGY